MIAYTVWSLLSKTLISSCCLRSGCYGYTTSIFRGQEFPGPSMVRVPQVITVSQITFASLAFWTVLLDKHWFMDMYCYLAHLLTIHCFSDCRYHFLLWCILVWPPYDICSLGHIINNLLLSDCFHFMIIDIHTLAYIFVIDSHVTVIMHTYIIL